MFASTSDRLSQDLNTAELRTTVLRGAFGPLGVAGLARAVDEPGSPLDQQPFTGPKGLQAGNLSFTENVRLAGFVDLQTRQEGGPIKRGTWCAFVAHGVGAVVLGSTLTRAQDEQLAADLQK